jgi:hypothetical protein
VNHPAIAVFFARILLLAISRTVVAQHNCAKPELISATGPPELPVFLAEVMHGLGVESRKPS